VAKRKRPPAYPQLRFEVPAATLQSLLKWFQGLEAVPRISVPQIPEDVVRSMQALQQQWRARWEQELEQEIERRWQEQQKKKKRRVRKRAGTGRPNVRPRAVAELTDVLIGDTRAHLQQQFGQPPYAHGAQRPMVGAAVDFLRAHGVELNELKHFRTVVRRIIKGIPYIRA
jgi:predicted Holliday junction resolvase-like endonuclease